MFRMYQSKVNYAKRIIKQKEPQQKCCGSLLYLSFCLLPISAPHLFLRPFPCCLNFPSLFSRTHSPVVQPTAPNPCPENGYFKPFIRFWNDFLWCRLSKTYTLHHQKTRKNLYFFKITQYPFYPVFPGYPAFYKNPKTCFAEPIEGTTNK